MKPTKKRAAKRTDNPMISKLLDLKYRINEAYRSGGGGEANKNDKSWVIARIRDIRDGMTLTKGEMLHCNNLWKEYSPSRLNDWESYTNG
tara:strand:+ start:732 stop:1001 length:270 start_codon:yes stop_codon:yes gene_type:complete